MMVRGVAWITALQEVLQEFATGNIKVQIQKCLSATKAGGCE